MLTLAVYSSSASTAVAEIQGWRDAHALQPARADQTPYVHTYKHSHRHTYARTWNDVDGDRKKTRDSPSSDVLVDDDVLCAIMRANKRSDEMITWGTTIRAHGSSPPMYL